LAALSLFDHELGGANILARLLQHVMAALRGGHPGQRAREARSTVRGEGHENGKTKKWPYLSPVLSAADDSSNWWAHSKTVWGTLITAAATVIPVFGPALGITLPADVITTFGNQAATAVQALAGLFGTVLAIYGRLNAAGALTLRKG
jgi:hypothetical protein